MLITDGAQVDVIGNGGGTILLEAGAITLTNRAQVRNGTSRALPGGDILVRANALTLSTGSEMIASAASGSSGNAGNVRVEAQSRGVT